MAQGAPLEEVGTSSYMSSSIMVEALHQESSVKVHTIRKASNDVDDWTLIEERSYVPTVFDNSSVPSPVTTPINTKCMSNDDWVSSTNLTAEFETKSVKVRLFCKNGIVHQIVDFNAKTFRDYGGADASDGLIIHCHGGGFIAQSPQSHEVCTSRTRLFHFLFRLFFFWAHIHLRCISAAGQASLKSRSSPSTTAWHQKSATPRAACSSSCLQLSLTHLLQSVTRVCLCLSLGSQAHLRAWVTRQDHHLCWRLCRRKPHLCSCTAMYC